MINRRLGEHKRKTMTITFCLFFALFCPLIPTIDRFHYIFAPFCNMGAGNYEVIALY